MTHRKNHAHSNVSRRGRPLLVLACSWPALLALSGCAEPGRTAQLEDRTRQGASPQLLAKAERLLQGRVVLVDGWNYEWSSQTLFRVYTSNGKDGIFLAKDNDYVQVNSPSALPVMNEVIQERHITRDDLGHAEAVFHYLSILVDLHEGPHRSIGSSTLLGVLGPEGIAEWSRGSKKTEISLRELCRDPQFIFDGNHWTVSFNVFEPDGRVEQWQVAGEFSAVTHSNKIHKITRSVVRKHGTFAWQAWG